MLISLACVVGGSDPSTPDVKPTLPPNEVVTFKLPFFSTSLNPGETIPGTKMTYVNREGDVFNVTINDLPAAKRVGDSFAWRGVMAPGVIGNYNLRISPTLLTGALIAGGSVEITVLNPIPVELGNDYNVLNSQLHFNNIAVDLDTGRGQQVNGTTLIFEGNTDQGAELSGTGSYPYRLLGDSLVWTGRLRGNVIVRNSMRVAEISDENLRLVGTAELWITSN